MLVAFARYSRGQAFSVLRQDAPFAVAMTIGSVAGSAVGGLLLGVVPTGILVPGLAALLLASAIKLWRH